MKLSASAFIWAAAVVKGGVPFGALEEGEKFRFDSCEHVLTKGKSGWYICPDGKKYRLNARVAVLRIHEKRI